jgi:dTDP-4-dehydrorhamnose 3,5-epimerase
MQVVPLSISKVLIIEPAIHRDARGFFSETFNARALAAAGVSCTFVQDNHVLSRARGVVRGLHFQAPPYAQSKLVRVTRGSIFDVAVDIRVGSPTFGHHVSAVISAENWRQLWIPVGFAHGYCTLEPDTEVVYKVTDYYAPASERSIRWNDPELAIAWPVAESAAGLSSKDAVAPQFSDLVSPFRYVASPDAARSQRAN